MRRNLGLLIYEGLLIWSAVFLSIHYKLPDVFDLLDRWQHHRSYIERMWIP